MSIRISLVLEHPITGSDMSLASGKALARVVEAHPVLAALMDFYSVDPVQIAVEVGMVYPSEEDGMDDLQEIDLGPSEWFEPSVGLAAVQQGIRAVQANPASLSAAIYDPSLRPADVLADLAVIEEALLLALQHETRFHLAMDTDCG